MVIASFIISIAALVIGLVALYRVLNLPIV